MALVHGVRCVSNQLLIRPIDAHERNKLHLRRHRLAGMRKALYPSGAKDDPREQWRLAVAARGYESKRQSSKSLGLSNYNIRR